MDKQVEISIEDLSEPLTYPAEAFTSPEYARAERDLLWPKVWQMAGRLEDIPEVGNFLTYNIMDESIIIVRTAADRLKAFYNVCPHRGRKLKEARGRDTELRCAFHGFAWELNGCLKQVPCQWDFPRLEPDEWGLPEVLVGTWGGFVFIKLDTASASAPGGSLIEALGPISERVARYPLADLRIAHRTIYDVAANWKVILENYNECYHCGPVHPELCRVVPAFREAGGAGLDWEAGIPHRDGAWTYTMSGTSERDRFAGLNEEELVRHKGEVLYPNMMLSLSADHAAVFALVPLAPDRTKIIFDLLLDPKELDRPGHGPEDALEFWDVVNRQDWRICEAVQQGMSSSVFKAGYYAPMEDYSLDMRRYIRETVGEPPMRGPAQR